MKQRILIPLLLALIAAAAAPRAFAQGSTTVKGICTDIDGKPIVGATVEWDNLDNGRKYPLKTDKKGQYFSLGIATGKYNVLLIQDGKELYHLNNLTIGVSEMVQDFDLKKEMANQAQGQGLTPEQLKAQQEAQAKVAKENTTIKALNEKRADAKKAADAGDFDTATKTLT